MESNNEIEPEEEQSWLEKEIEEQNREESKSISRWGDGGMKGEKAKTRKRGRPTRAKSLTRERSKSVSSVSSVASWISKRGRDNDTEDSEPARKRECAMENRPEDKGDKKKSDRIAVNRVEKEERIKEIKMNKGELKGDERSVGGADLMKELNDGMEKMKDELEQLRVEYKKREESKQEINNLKQKIQELKRKEETRERREKKNNIVLRGAKVCMGVENAKQAAKKVMKELGEVGKEGTCKDAFFIGGMKEKAVIVKLDSFESKLRVMGKKSRLYGK